MSRVKRGTTASKRRNYLLARAKGYSAKGKSIFRLAKQRLLKAEDNAYISRKLRKRDFRQLWIQRINGALDSIGSELSYSKFIGLLNRSDIKLNRKMISEIAIADIEGFKVIVSKVEGGNYSPKAESKEDKTKAKASAKSAPKVEKASTKAPKETKDEVIESIENHLQDLKESVDDTEVKVEKVSKVVETEAVKAEEEAPKKKTKKSTDADDLKVVEGIGPAIEKVLHSNEITTYELLANSEVDALKAILSAAGSNYAIHNPSTWPKQAKLAAEGKFDELEKLKDELVNGKEVA
ncbi:MAG: 50S ribosomal protein L20 [Patescibacteria group bacterium]